MSELMEATDEPPDTQEKTSILEEYREPIQSVGSNRLVSRDLHLHNSGDMHSGRIEMVYICHSPGAKPWLGYHNSS